MITQTVTVNCKDTQNIIIGRRGTYDTECVVFDVSYLVNTFGNGTPVLLVKRPTDETPYPVVTTSDGNLVTWNVTETDTSYKGHGECELFWYVDGGLAKSIIYNIAILRDIIGIADNPPDPYQTWVDDLTELGAETLQNAQDAAQSASDASGYADDALNSKNAAETAQGKAEDAQTGAETAQGKAEDAQAAAEEAQQAIENMTASASGLPAGSSPTVTKTEVGGVVNLAFGIPKGDKGDKGNTGDAATVDVGQTTTGAPGSDAAVTNSGDEHNAVFNFAIPRGNTGATGNGIASIVKTATSGLVDTYTVTYTNGNTMTFTVTNGANGEITASSIASAFSSSNSYVKGTYVIYSGQLYMFTADHAAGGWTGTDAQAVKLADTVGDLKNTITALNKSDTAVEWANGGTGTYIDYSTGAVSSESFAQFSYTDYVDVSIYAQIMYKRTKHTIANPKVGMAFYTSEKAYITGVQALKNQSAIGYEDSYYAVDVPATAVYARFTYYSDTATYGTFQIYGNSELQSEIINDKWDISKETDFASGATWTENYEITVNGAISEEEGMRYSSLIPVTDGKHYLLVYHPYKSVITRVHGYNNSGTWVKQLAVSASADSTVTLIRIVDCTGISAVRISTGVESSTDIEGFYLYGNLATNLEVMQNNMRWEEIPMYNGGYIVTNNNTAYISNYNILSQTHASCAVVDCKEGDLFTINARGAGAPRAYAFIDANNKILEMAKDAANVHGIFKAPAGTAKLVINDYNGFSSYRNAEPMAGYDKICAIQEVTPVKLGGKNWVARLGWETNRVGYGVPMFQTIPSYKLAYNNNCRIMLADVRLTADADNVFVCLHDANLQNYVKHADGSALSSAEKAQLVADLTLEELNVYDWGITAGAIYAGTKVLTVNEFLRFCSYTGCIAVLEIKIGFDQTKVQALAKLVAKHCMLDRVVIFDDVYDYNTNKAYFKAAFPNAEVVLNNITTDNAYNTAKAIAEDLGAECIPVSLSTAFGYMTDEKLAEWAALGGMCYYTEVTSVSDLETLNTAGHIDCCRFIASSYVNVNEWLMKQFGL